MYRWVLLLDDGPKRSNRRLCRRCILSCLSDSVYKLRYGQVFFLVIVNCMRELSRWNLYGLDWVDDMYGVSCRLLLRHNWPVCSDCLRDREILIGVIVRVLELPRWDLHGLDCIVLMHCMHRWLILRHDRSDSSNWRMRRGYIFSCLCDSVL